MIHAITAVTSLLTETLVSTTNKALWVNQHNHINIAGQTVAYMNHWTMENNQIEDTNTDDHEQTTLLEGPP